MQFAYGPHVGSPRAQHLSSTPLSLYRASLSLGLDEMQSSLVSEPQSPAPSQTLSPWTSQIQVTVFTNTDWPFPLPPVGLSINSLALSFGCPIGGNGRRGQLKNQ